MSFAHVSTFSLCGSLRASGFSVLGDLSGARPKYYPARLSALQLVSIFSDNSSPGPSCPFSSVRSSKKLQRAGIFVLLSYTEVNTSRSFTRATGAQEATVNKRIGHDVAGVQARIFLLVADLRAGIGSTCEPGRRPMLRLS